MREQGGTFIERALEHDQEHGACAGGSMRPRPTRAPKPHAERLARDGAVLLSHNHLALLQGLLDRPRATACSKRDLIAAARPYVVRARGFASCYSTMSLAVSTLHPRWVRWRQEGGRLVYRLRPRGRAILDGQVPARIVGKGMYRPGRVAP
jgi:hypothetical protein